MAPPFGSRSKIATRVSPGKKIKTTQNGPSCGAAGDDRRLRKKAIMAF